MHKRCLYPLEPSPWFESCSIPSLFCWCGMQNHTHQTHGNVYSEGYVWARQRWGNEHADDTQKRWNAERERRQQMRANERKFRRERQKDRESKTAKENNSLSDNLTFWGDSVTLDHVNASISKPSPILHGFTLQLAKLTALPSSLYFSKSPCKWGSKNTNLATLAPSLIFPLKYFTSCSFYCISRTTSLLLLHG